MLMTFCCITMAPVHPKAEFYYNSKSAVYEFTVAVRDICVITFFFIPLRKFSIDIKMETTPLVSVIIPVADKQAYLSKCLRSVLRQSWTTIEIVIVDDCSTDRSAALARYLLKGRKNVSIIQNNRKLGPLKTRYVGVDNSKGQYITFLDADDWLEPRAIEVMVKTIIDYGVDLVQIRNRRRMRGMSVHHQEHFDPELANRRIEGDEFRVMASYVGMDSYIYPGCPGKLYVTSKLRETARVEFGQSWGEEQIFNIQYLRECKSMTLSNFVGYNYRWNGRTSPEYKYSALRNFKNVHHYKQMLGQSEEYINREIQDLLRYHIRSLITELGYTREAVEMLMAEELRDPLWARVGVNEDAATIVRQEYADVQRQSMKYLAKRLLK